MVDAARMICTSDALAERGKGVRFTLEHRGETRAAFAIRFEGRVYGYLKSCAHVSVELDWLEPVNHYRVRCVVAKIVDGKALGAAHIAAAATR